VRRLIATLLLLCLPLQGFAMQWGQLPAGGTASSIVHELDHDYGVRHHHHEADGSVHYDDSDESVKHLQEHSSGQPAGIIAQTTLGAPPQPVSSILVEVTQFLPDPLPDCPHRPPARSLG